MLDHAEYEDVRNFPKIVEDLGYPCINTQYIPFSEDNDSFKDAPTDRPVIVYGTHGFIKQSRKYGFYSFCREENLKVSSWMPKFPNHMMLNNGCWYPWESIKEKMMASAFDSIFIRPDAVTKTFTGQVVRPNDYKSFIEKTDAMSGIGEGTWIFTSDPVSITAEYRYFIVGGKVVAGSQYRRDNKLDIRQDTSLTADQLAKIVAEWKWQPDDCYVVDIADTDFGPQIIEFNSMSCAGLYACDQKAIIESVSHFVERDWNHMQYEPNRRK